MTAWVIMGIAVTAAILALVLRGTQPAYAMCLTVAAGLLLFASAIGMAVPLVERVSGLLSGVIDSTYTHILLKALGISLLTQTAADVCRDAGESALASKAEFGGQVLLLACALPLFEHAAVLLEQLIRSQTGVV